MRSFFRGRSLNLLTDLLLGMDAGCRLPAAQKETKHLTDGELRKVLEGSSRKMVAVFISDVARKQSGGISFPGQLEEQNLKGSSAN